MSDTFKISKEDLRSNERKANRKAVVESGHYMSNPPKIVPSEKEYKRKEKHKKRYDGD